MVPPKVKPQFPKSEVEIKEKLLKSDIFIEVENQYDVEVNTTSVKSSTKVSEKTKDSRVLTNL